MGILGWAPRVFWRATLPELLAAYRGYQLREDRADLRAGLQAAAVYEQNRDPKKQDEPFTAYTFFPHLRPKQTVTIDETHDLSTPEDDEDSITDDAFLAALKGPNGTRTPDPAS